MGDYNQSKIKILEDSIGGKLFADKKTVIWEFLEKYIIISLIPFTIYKLAINIISNMKGKQTFHLQFSIQNIGRYTEICTNFLNITFIISLVFILSNFVVLFASSKLIFRKYKIKKSDFNTVSKTVVIIQLFLLVITSFLFWANYYDNEPILGDKFMSLAISQNTNKEEGFTDSDVKQYIDEINITNKIYFIFLIIINIACFSLCILIQRRIIIQNTSNEITIN